MSIPTFLFIAFTIAAGAKSIPEILPNPNKPNRSPWYIALFFISLFLFAGFLVSANNDLSLPNPRITVEDNEFVFSNKTSNLTQLFSSVEYDYEGTQDSITCNFEHPVEVNLTLDSETILWFHARGLVQVGDEQSERIGVDEFGRKWVGKKPEPIYVEFTATYKGKTYVGYNVRPSDIKVTGKDKKGNSHNIDGFSFYLDEKFKEDTKLKNSTQEIHVEYETADGEHYECECSIEDVHKPVLMAISAKLLEDYSNGVLLSKKLEPDMFEVHGTYEDGLSRKLDEFQIDPVESDAQGDCDVTIGAEGKSTTISVHWIEKPPAEQEKEPNNKIIDGEPTKIALNSSVRGNIAGENDVDYYSFLLPSDKKGKVSFTFAHEPEDDGTVCWKIDLFQFEEESNPPLTCKSSRSQAEVFSGNTRITGGSWYYVKVSPDYGQAEDPYTLTVNYEEEDAFFETEPNNEQQQATEIDPKADRPYTGNLTNSGDRDYYHLKLDQKGMVQATFAHDKRENDGIGWKLTVIGKDVGEDDAKIDSTTSSGKTAQTKTHRYRLPAGDCWLKVESGHNWSDEGRESNMDYTLLVTFKPEGDEFESEPNNNYQPSSDTKPVANPIANGQKVIGNIHTGNDKDFYYFDYNGSGHLTLDFGHQRVDNNQTFWQVSLVGPESDALKNDEGDARIHIQGNGSETETSTWENLVQGRYHVIVEPYNGNYLDNDNNDYSVLISW